MSCTLLGNRSECDEAYAANMMALTNLFRGTRRVEPLALAASHFQERGASAGRECSLRVRRALRRIWRKKWVNVRWLKKFEGTDMGSRVLMSHGLRCVADSGSNTMCK